MRICIPIKILSIFASGKLTGFSVSRGGSSLVSVIHILCQNDLKAPMCTANKFRRIKRKEFIMYLHLPVACTL